MAPKNRRAGAMTTIITPLASVVRSQLIMSFVLCSAYTTSWVSDHHAPPTRATTTTHRDHPVSTFLPPTVRWASDPRRTHDGDENGALPRSFSSLEGVLSQAGYDRRLMGLSHSDLPVLAEVFVNGEARIARVIAIHTGGDGADGRNDGGRGGSWVDPKVTVEVGGPETAPAVLDFGQVTTVLRDITSATTDALGATLPSREVPPPHVVEKALDRLYHSRVGRGRDPRKGGLSKKQVGDLVSRFRAEHQAHVDRILRHALKAGSGLSRLVDAPTVRSALFSGCDKSRAAAAAPAADVAQTHAASRVLSADAATGGRFKRWPCVAVASDASGLRFLNGGWLVVDQSVRAGSEARKFANFEERPPAAAPWTPANARIAQRLECLAMGEALSALVSSRRGHQPLSSLPEATSLELDVRETLRAMNLPATPSGAKEALVRVGRWAGTEDFSLVEPWSKDVLEAAAWYAAHRSSARDDDATRVDLTMYPSLCVDAQRTSFRDDAIGVRPRASTGRKVIPEASQWEVLVHVVDVTDVYSESSAPQLTTLRQASKSRGTSRYDLPLGALHLLPPRVLESLSLSRRQESRHRCVTVWAYIDERDGSLLDVGLERTLIRSPSLLSFRDATALLEETDQKGRGDEGAKNRVLLMALERSLTRWVEHRIRASTSAQKREKRLSQREQDAATNAEGLMDDSGRAGFQRSRGHRLVDAALDLYSSGVYQLLRHAKAPVPESKGADSSRGGRLATAPLRRYVDGEAQRQAVAVLCQRGRILTASECKEIGRASNQARNSVSNLRASRKKK